MDRGTRDRTRPATDHGLNHALATLASRRLLVAARTGERLGVAPRQLACRGAVPPDGSSAPHGVHRRDGVCLWKHGGLNGGLRAGDAESSRNRCLRSRLSIRHISQAVHRTRPVSSSHRCCFVRENRVPDDAVTRYGNRNVVGPAGLHHSAHRLGLADTSPDPDLCRSPPFERPVGILRGRWPGLPVATKAYTAPCASTYSAYSEWLLAM